MIVTDNLFGDIIPDLAGAVTGGIGYAANGNINAVGEFPSCSSPYTAPHRTSPQNKANPTAAILAGAMLLRHLGHDAAAARMRTLSKQICAKRCQCGTDQVGADVLTRLG